MLFDTLKAFDEIHRDADISACTRYRYTLKRWWNLDGPWATWIMLNPSTADASIDDRTIRKCTHYSKAIGMSGFTVVNLYAWRATDPDELKACEDPIGPENNWWIKTCILASKGPIIAAWGTAGGTRADAVLKMLAPREVQCLKITKDGHPQHPLYLPNSCRPIPWKGFPE